MLLLHCSGVRASLPVVPGDVVFVQEPDGETLSASGGFSLPWCKTGVHGKFANIRQMLFKLILSPAFHLSPKTKSTCTPVHLFATREHFGIAHLAGRIPRFYFLPVYYFELCYEIGTVGSPPDLQSPCLFPVVRRQRHPPDISRFLQFDTTVERIRGMDVDHPRRRSFVSVTWTPTEILVPARNPIAVASEAPCRLTTMVIASHLAPPSMAITTLRETRVLRRDSRKGMSGRIYVLDIQ